MKVSINWIREINSKYQTAAEPMPEGIDALVEKIGAQLGAVDEVADLGKKYEGIVVAKIISCEKHPNADKLSICLIDDSGVVKGVARNSKGYVQVVCGAPNAKAALQVAWIPPGVVVPATANKDPFVLESREIRGETSNGMLASPKELDLGDNHEGILIIEEATKPGQPFAEVYGLNDYIIDIENKMFTHRPDLFGLLGIARELAGIQGMVFKSPKWYRFDSKIQIDGRSNGLKLKVGNDVPKLVPRFCMVALADVRVGPSPMWLQSKLNRVGIRPINNIVDLTNYYMHETAQPLHAYDYDKVKRLSSSEASINVRLSKAGEEVTLLGGKRQKLEGGTVVIATDKQVIGLGGVMGGAETEVDQNTRNIILEVGTFDMNITRKTAMEYGLFTDAATRFTKGQSPLQNMAVISKVLEEIKKLAGGRVASAVHDIHGVLTKPAGVSTTAEFINSRLGLSLSAAQITKLLKNVEFEAESVGNSLKYTAPFWRTDIEIPEDIVEEVGRLYGYDKLPLELPSKNIVPAVEDAELKFKFRLRNALCGAGANEVLTYSFVDSRLMEAAGQESKNAYHIRNALSPDLQYYRQSLTPSLLSKVHPNIKAGFASFALFEIGLAHIKGVNDGEKLPTQLKRLALTAAFKQKTPVAPYYWAKRYLEHLLFNELFITDLSYVPLNEISKLPHQWQLATGAYEPARSAAVYCAQHLLGILGEPSVVIKDRLKLPASTAQFEIDTEAIAKLSPNVRQYVPLNRYPSLEQDITLKVESGLRYSLIEELLRNELGRIQSQNGIHAWWSPLDIYQNPKDKSHKQITWRITLSHPERTLTTVETNNLLDELAKCAHAKFGAVRI